MGKSLVAIRVSRIHLISRPACRGFPAGQLTEVLILALSGGRTIRRQLAAGSARSDGAGEGRACGAIFFCILGDQSCQHTLTHATSASLWYLAASCAAAAIACCVLPVGVPRECHESVTPGR